jgi:hypothetical protein
VHPVFVAVTQQPLSCRIVVFQEWLLCFRFAGRFLRTAAGDLHHPTQTATPQTRNSVRRASGSVQISILLVDPVKTSDGNSDS